MAVIEYYINAFLCMISRYPDLLERPNLGDSEFEMVCGNAVIGSLRRGKACDIKYKFTMTMIRAVSKRQ